MSPLEVLSPAARKLRYYSIPQAGAQVGLKRSPSYAAAAAGEIPTEKHGRFRLVPRKAWDRKVRRLLGKPAPLLGVPPLKKRPHRARSRKPAAPANEARP